jgi:ABC-type branched-subunit amino acid transport system substrate-binding protein
MFLPSAPHTYDAVYAAAYALHSLLYEIGAQNITADALGTELKINVSFYGTTGLIEFDSVTTHIYLLLKLNV